MPDEKLALFLCLSLEQTRAVKRYVVEVLGLEPTDKVCRKVVRAAYRYGLEELTGVKPNERKDIETEDFDEADYSFV